MSAESIDQLVLKQLQRLFELCAAGDFRTASTMLLYKDGTDRTRELRDTMNYTVEAERRQVDAICGRIKGWLAESDHHDFGDFIVQETEGRQWHAWEVRFYKGPDRIVRYFGFLFVGGQYALGDIDR